MDEVKRQYAYNTGMQSGGKTSHLFFGPDGYESVPDCFHREISLLKTCKIRMCKGHEKCLSGYYERLQRKKI